MNKAGGMTLFWDSDVKILQVQHTSFTVEAKIEDQEKKWGERCRAEWSFNDFRNFLSTNQMVDLGFEGQPWTWCNNWGNEGEIMQRLDRPMSSADWNLEFESVKCSHIKTYASDHCALMIDTKPTVVRKKRRFFFDKRWLQHENIAEVVKKAWKENIEGFRMYQVQSKLRNYRVALLKWSNGIHKNSKDKIDNLKKQLDQTRKSAMDNKREKVAGLKTQLIEAYNEEEIYWSQKARLKWLQEGDRNTQYFHAQVNGRRKQNRLQRLQREDGGWTKSEEETGKVIADYYRNLFAKSSDSNAQEVLEGIPTTITAEMNRELTKEVTEEEIKNAFFTMDCNKAPGSDTFIPGRHIIDNIIISHEYLHFLKNKRLGKDGYMAVKLDMSKAYDRASCQEAQELTKILRSYEQASGQMINLDKSSACFSKNVNQESKEAVCSKLEGIEQVAQEKYLGLPIVVTRSKKQLFGYIKENIERRMQNWKSKLLSSAGKEILIKAVSMAMPTYTMSCFKLPCREAMWRGVRRRIGNGRKTSIWNDQWILSNGKGKPVTAKSQGGKLDKVADLISNFRWNRTLIFKTFCKEDADNILKIPISITGRDDNTFWTRNINGEYTVQSGYKMEMERKEEVIRKEGEGVETSFNSVSQQMWKKVAVLVVVDGQQQQQMRTGGWSWVDDGLAIRVSQEEVEEHEEVQGWCRAVVMEVRRRWWR
ncbi:uncharacterized protein LOC113774437 [Coffea eugenioides]|uniref:uncharacterized protein LOC113774437 n=1 Tax=Coffea eugenioides TaxID=49369 RepID=UPI000F60BF6B|nr:uncharacterized protein LOC113774437 [Coffea eugenioides]